MDTPYAIVHRQVVASTQDEAAEEMERRGSPVLVVADHQTAGRGRRGRPWWEADRSLFASYAFRPAWPTEHWSLVPLVAGLAARRAIDETTGVRVDLRWPNDLVLPAGKVGGILAEATDGRAVVGLGLNLYWGHPPRGAAGLLATDPGPDLGLELARAWAEELLHRLARHPAEWGRDEYRAVCVTLGRRVSWDGGEGRAVDVAADGTLVVDTGEGAVTVTAGEVRQYEAGNLPGSETGET